MRFTTDENEDCRDIAVRVREMGECQPIYEDDTNPEFFEVLMAINIAQKELPKEVRREINRRWAKKHPEYIREKNRRYRLSHIEQERERKREYRMKKKGEI
jgi:hypothetical protein